MSTPTETKNLGIVDLDTPLPLELTALFEPLECKLCHVKATSAVTAYAHYEGKIHCKNVCKYLQTNYNVGKQFKKAKTEFKQTTCETCNVILSSEIQAQIHFSGKLHAWNVKNPVVEYHSNFEAVTTAGGAECGVGEEPDANELNREDVEPSDDCPYCGICDIYCKTEQQMEMHKASPKHIENVAYLSNLVEEEAKVKGIPVRKERCNNENACSDDSSLEESDSENSQLPQAAWPTGSQVYQTPAVNDPLTMVAQALTTLVAGALGQCQNSYQQPSVPSMVPYQQQYQYQGTYYPQNTSLCNPTALGGHGSTIHGAAKKLKLSDVRKWLPYYKNQKDKYECIPCNWSVSTADKFVSHLNSKKHWVSMIKYSF